MKAFTPKYNSYNPKETYPSPYAFITDKNWNKMLGNGAEFILSIPNGKKTGVADYAHWIAPGTDPSVRDVHLSAPCHGGALSCPRFKPGTIYEKSEGRGPYLYAEALRAYEENRTFNEYLVCHKQSPYRDYIKDLLVVAEKGIVRGWLAHGRMNASVLGNLGICTRQVTEKHKGKLWNACLEFGMDRVDAFMLLPICTWNTSEKYIQILSYAEGHSPWSTTEVNIRRLYRKELSDAGNNFSVHDGKGHGASNVKWHTGRTASSQDFYNAVKKVLIQNQPDGWGKPPKNRLTLEQQLGELHAICKDFRKRHRKKKNS